MEASGYKMDILFKRYEELLNRLDKSEIWLVENNFADWEQVKKEDTQRYQLRKNIEMQIESIRKTIHNKLDLRYER